MEQDHIRNLKILIAEDDECSRILIEKTIPAGQTQYQLETAGWNTGVYFVEIRSGQKISTEKLLVHH